MSIPPTHTTSDAVRLPRKWHSLEGGVLARNTATGVLVREAWGDEFTHGVLTFIPGESVAHYWTMRATTDAEGAVVVNFTLTIGLESIVVGTIGSYYTKAAAQAFLSLTRGELQTMPVNADVSIPSPDEIVERAIKLRAALETEGSA